MRFTGERIVNINETPKAMKEDHLYRYLFLKNFIKEKDRVIDIACGTGYGTKIISEFSKHVVGVDISREAVSYAKSSYKGIENSFIVGDACDYVHTHKFDIVVSYETIEHIKNFEKVIKNYNRLLNKEGLLFVSSPNRTIKSPNRKFSDQPKNKFHTQEFTISELSEYLKNAGFNILSVYGQRKELNIRNNLLRKYYHKIIRLHERTSPKLKKLSKISFLHPRYFIIVAKKKINI